MGEFSEAMQAGLEGKPEHLQIKEIDDVINQAEILKQAIICRTKDDVRRDYEAANGNGRGSYVGLRK